MEYAPENFTIGQCLIFPWKLYNRAVWNKHLVINPKIYGIFYSSFCFALENRPENGSHTVSDLSASQCLICRSKKELFVSSKTCQHIRKYLLWEDYDLIS